ncbi:MAG: hypothetical protein IT383_05175 [Deltaproteobacteria bacterium]|nr:hypothetical protein [Deltaproteobacteria bacterium]
MALLSRFTRDTRFVEIGGCPLGPDGSDDQSACARCPYNALLAGKARVGCVASTAPQQLENALARLRSIDAPACTRLRTILDAEQHAPETTGLPPGDLEELGRIAARWSAVCSNDVDERQVVAILAGFAERARATDEPVRVLG